MGRRNKYSEEFKKDAVRLFITRGERTAEEVAESLGIASNMLYRWKKKYELSITGVVASQDNNEETENLRRRLRQLEMENALLKKAAAFFAKVQASAREPRSPTSSSMRRRRNFRLCFLVEF